MKCVKRVLVLQRRAGGGTDSSRENPLFLWEGSQTELCGTTSSARFVADSDISCRKSNKRKVSHNGEYLDYHGVYLFLKDPDP